MYVAALEDNGLIYPDLDVLFYAIDVEIYPANAHANSFNSSIKDDSGNFDYKKSQYAIYSDEEYQPKDLLEALKGVSNEFTSMLNKDPIFHEFQNLAALINNNNDNDKIIIPKDGNIFSWAASIYEQLSDDNKKIYHDLGAMELYAVAIKIITDQLIPGLNPIRHGPESNTPVYAEEMLYMLLTKRKDSSANKLVRIIASNFEQTTNAEQLFDNYIAKLKSDKNEADETLMFGIHPVWIDKYSKADELIKLMIKNICDKQIQKSTFDAKRYLDRIMFEMLKKKLEFITFHMKSYPTLSKEQKAKYDKEIARYDSGINKTEKYIKEAINKLDATHRPAPAAQPLPTVAQPLPKAAQPLPTVAQHLYRCIRRRGKPSP